MPLILSGSGGILRRCGPAFGTLSVVMVVAEVGPGKSWAGGSSASSVAVVPSVRIGAA